MAQLKLSVMSALSALVVVACSDPGTVAGPDGAGPDVSAPSDSGTAIVDVGATSDDDASLDVAQDAHSEPDGRVVVDSGVALDSGVPFDSGVALDSGSPFDSGVVVDAGVCPPGTASCGGRCVDTTSSASNCGFCGNVCAAPSNAVAACSAGTCGIGACNAGFANCDGNAANGCEVDTRSSVLNCGACGSACPARANASSTCAASACGFSCNAGFANCDGVASNGCEASTQSDPNHCGACGVRCGAGTTCVAGSCRASCDPPLSVCGVAMSCVDTRSDLRNCGACGNVCPARANASSTCAASACGFSCNAGFANCDGVASNGCEASTQSDPNHCGACANACPAPMNATRACLAGSCGIGACNAGFANCDGNAANGCEVDTRSSVLNCGACGSACPARANASSTCAASACGFSCNAGFANCDGVASNGCEASTQSDPDHCGACANACPAVSNGARACVAGACAPSCNPGYHRAGSGCFPDGLAVRLIAPLSVSTVTNTRPTLEWSVPVGADGVEIEVCRDRSCTMVLETIRTSSSSARVSVTLAQGPVFWRGRARVGALVDAPSSGTWVFHVREMRVLAAPMQTLHGRVDVNGDGYDDVVVGAPSARRGGVLKGALHVFHGSAGGASATPSTVIVGSGSYLDGAYGIGRRIASAGDVNGDGFGDLLVSETSLVVGGMVVGGVSLYLGSATGLSATPATQWIGTPSSTIPTPGAGFSTAGDLNHDGFADVAIGYPGESNGGVLRVGAVRVFLGSRTGIDLSAPITRYGRLANEALGTSIAGGMDSDGDGFSDLFVGAPGYDFDPVTLVDVGQVVRLRGTASGLDATQTQMTRGTARNASVGSDLTMFYSSSYGPCFLSSAPGHFGNWTYVGGHSQCTGTFGFQGSLASIFDFNGDGRYEVAHGYADEVSVFFDFFESAANRWGTQRVARPSRTGLDFGATVSGGDFNGDGFDDVLVGVARGGVAGVGSVRVFQGGRTVPTIPSMLPTHSREWEGDANNAAFYFLPR